MKTGQPCRARRGTEGHRPLPRARPTRRGLALAKLGPTISTPAGRTMVGGMEGAVGGGGGGRGRETGGGQMSTEARETRDHPRRPPAAAAFARARARRRPRGRSARSRPGPARQSVPSRGAQSSVTDPRAAPGHPPPNSAGSAGLSSQAGNAASTVSEAARDRARGSLARSPPWPTEGPQRRAWSLQASRAFLGLPSNARQGVDRGPRALAWRHH